MKRVFRRIIGGTVLSGCAMLTLYGASIISDKAVNNALPVSVTEDSSETPIIVLDAGHGESA